MSGDYYELVEEIADYFEGKRAMPEIPRWQLHLKESYIQQGREMAEVRARLAVQDAVRAAEYRKAWASKWGGRTQAAPLSPHEQAVINEAIQIMRRSGQ